MTAKDVSFWVKTGAMLFVAALALFLFGALGMVKTGLRR